MNEKNSGELPEMKLLNEYVEVEFQVEINEEYKGDKKAHRKKRSHFDRKVSGINETIAANDTEIDGLTAEIERLTNNADLYDNLVAVGSGLLAGIFDSLWVGEFDFKEGKAWSNKSVNKTVMSIAKKQGYNGERLDGAIRFLEDKFQIPSDNIWKGKNIGVGAKTHHLHDLAHHPTPLGWFVSILTQFTRKGYFHNTTGEFIPISIDETGQNLIGNNFAAKIFSGTVNWFFHLVSDMSGSNKTAGVGMGIPGPIVSLLKEASMIPGFNNAEISKKIKDIFVKERFDLRSELAVVHQLGKQALPVILNEILVRSFYFIRRLLSEYKSVGKLKGIEWKKVLPFNNRTIARMMTIATGTFTLVDTLDASIRGAIKSGGEPALFAKEFLLRINFVGVGRFAVAITTDVRMGLKKNKLSDERIALLSQQLHLLNTKVFYQQAGMWAAAESTEETINETVIVMEKAVSHSIEIWAENRKSMRNIGNFSEGIKANNPGLDDDINNIINWG